VPVPEHTLIERLWYGDGPGAGATRLLLAPAERVFSGIAGVRDMLYDAGWLPTHEPAIPAISIGNLTVGGTGKTPIAAWIARELAARGVNPSVVLRGYGDDEPLVHGVLNPSVPVITDADRVRGVDEARDAGADCAILDDGFQHRRIRRTENWLLVSAERWRVVERCLPAGPLREPVSAINRASLVVVTRKSGTQERAEEVAARLSGRAPDIPVAIFSLTLDGLRNARDGSSQPLSRLDGLRVVAVAAIGAPDEFFMQLRGEGARVDEAAFRDHHPFNAHDVAQLAERGLRGDLVVCTLKDAVKLVPLWPQKGPPLWYVSQRAVVERGQDALEGSLRNILASRVGAAPTAGNAGLDSTDHGYRSSTADQ